MTSGRPVREPRPHDLICHSQTPPLQGPPGADATAMIRHARATLPNCFAGTYTPTFVLMIFCSLVIALASLRGHRELARASG